MILENERARLLPFTLEKAQDLSAIIYDETIWKYMGHYIKDENDLKTYILSTIKVSNDQSVIPFLVVDKRHNLVAGSTRFGKIDLNNKRAEIGWTWYGAKFQGTGLNGAVKALMLQYGFEELRLQRLQFGADVRNIRSQKAIEKLGARKEGIRYSHYIDSEGIAQDDVYYSLIKNQWEEMNATSSGINVL